MAKRKSSAGEGGCKDAMVDKRKTISSTLHKGDPKRKLFKSSALGKAEEYKGYVTSEVADDYPPSGTMT